MQIELTRQVSYQSRAAHTAPAAAQEKTKRWGNWTNFLSRFATVGGAAYVAGEAVKRPDPKTQIIRQLAPIIIPPPATE